MPDAITLSTALDDPDASPYFLWERPMTVAELRNRLAAGDEDERLRLLAVIVREARDTDVWRFPTPREVMARWPELQGRLGRRRAFWAFLLDRWRELGLAD